MAGDTYSKAGVNLEVSQSITDTIKSIVSPHLGPEVIGGVGFFGGMYDLKGYREPVLVSSTDSVGTKVKIANLMGKFDTLGVDLVNHCINDIFTCGAKPLFFLDYIAMGALVPDKVADLVKGVVQACQTTGCYLIGGETAELPGVYPDDEFDLVGFVVGSVEKDSLQDSSRIEDGDLLIGIPSNGLHTNGYSLARQVFDLEGNSSILNHVYEGLGVTLGDALLEPHICYYPSLNPVMPLIKGMAHITGGGLPENVPRILPDGLGAVFNTESWDNLPIFELIQRVGKVDRDEMFRVFNMGLGMVIAASPGQAEEVCSLVEGSRLVGKVSNNTGESRIVLTGK